MILNKLKNHPKIRKIPIFIFLSFVFVFFLDLYSTANAFKSLQTLNNGIQTCFSRVNQSFVSKVFSQNKNSIHLKPEFFSKTEECLGDVLKQGEPIFSQLGKEIDPKINSLVSEIYWLHKDFSGNVELEKLKKRFKNIETLNVESMKVLEKLDLFGNNKIEDRKLWFYFSYLGLFLFLLLDILVSTRNTEEITKQEERVDKKTEIISSVLNYPVIPSIPKPIFNGNFQNLNSIINLPVGIKTESEELSTIESAYFDDILTKVIDFLSVPLFTKGIKLDLDIDEDLKVYISEEVLEQSLFSFLNFSINNFPENSLDRKITLKTKLLGETAIFEINNNGVPFGDDFIKDANGLNLSNEINKRLLDIKIGMELIKDNSGNVYFENYSEGPVIRIKLKSKKVKSQKVRTRIVRNNNLVSAI